MVGDDVVADARMHRHRQSSRNAWARIDACFQRCFDLRSGPAGKPLLADRLEQVGAGRGERMSRLGAIARARSSAAGRVAPSSWMNRPSAVAVALAARPPAMRARWMFGAVSSQVPKVPVATFSRRSRSSGRPGSIPSRGSCPAPLVARWVSQPSLHHLAEDVRRAVAEQVGAVDEHHAGPARRAAQDLGRAAAIELRRPRPAAAAAGGRRARSGSRRRAVRLVRSASGQT